MVKLIEITDSFIQIVNDVVVMCCLGKGTLEAHFPPISHSLANYGKSKCDAIFVNEETNALSKAS